MGGADAPQMGVSSSESNGDAGDTTRDMSNRALDGDNGAAGTDPVRADQGLVATNLTDTSAARR